MLPDDVLLEIFDFYVDGYAYDFRSDFEPVKGSTGEEWIKLAHVCRRWRSVVFQSPHRLNLQLLCTPYTRVRDTLDIWPPFPLLIYNFSEIPYKDEELTSLDNIVAALEHNDRVSAIRLYDLSSSQMGYVTDSAAMQKPFPELIDLLLLIFDDGPEPILPDSFLGKTAPRLRSLYLSWVPFPGIPKLLVELYLSNIPSSGYIPPVVMATGLSA
jgi:hypothetical protein